MDRRQLVAAQDATLARCHQLDAQTEKTSGHRADAKQTSHQSSYGFRIPAPEDGAEEKEEEQGEDISPEQRLPIAKDQLQFDNGVEQPGVHSRIFLPVNSMKTS